MSTIDPVNVAGHVFDIHPDLSVSTRARKAGLPERIEGMTLGIVTLTQDAPHGGEVHPDGDEILYVISGRLRVIGESDLSAAVELKAGDACIVRRGEWHSVRVIEPAQLVHVTPGPRGDHRPLS